MRRVLVHAAALLLTTAAVPFVGSSAGAAAPARSTTTARSATAAGVTPCSLAPLPSSPALTALHARLASAATRRVRLLALGSSTTYGMDLADPTQKWPDRLMQGLAARGIDADPVSVGPLDPAVLSRAPGALMVDGARPGTLAETYLAEDLPGLLVSRASGNAPDIVFHMIGANDYYVQNPPAVYGVALRAATAALDAQLHHPIHVYVSDYTDPATKDPHFPWSAYRAQMRQVAAEDPDHRLFIDLTPWFDKVDVPGSDPRGYLDSGGVHPSAAGHAVIAKLILRALGYGC